jgi:hypothetical protein
MKLSEISNDNQIKCLIVGPSGTGKTVCAAGFPTGIEYHDFDNKIQSAAYFYRKDAERLSGIEVKAYGALPRNEKIKQWEVRVKEIETLSAKGQLPFKTLVLDSLTTFTHAILEDYIYRSQTGIKRPVAGLNAQQDYALLDRHLTQIISGLLSLNCNVVFIGHEVAEKDELTGAITRKPLMAGKFADKLSIYFPEVYYSKVNSEGKYLLQANADAQRNARTQRGLPKEIESSYAAITKAY